MICATEDPRRCAAPACGDPIENGCIRVDGPRRVIVTEDVLDEDPHLVAFFHERCVERRFGPEYTWPRYDGGRDYVMRELLRLARRTARRRGAA